MKPSPAPGIDSASSVDSLYYRGDEGINNSDRSICHQKEDDDLDQGNGNQNAEENHPKDEDEIDRVHSFDFGARFVVRDEVLMTQPHSGLPKPEAPPGASEQGVPSPETLETPALVAIGKFFRDKSATITRRISSLKSEEEDGVKEFNLVGVKVTKSLKEDKKELNGRITFFSRSNCRDSGAMRSFFRKNNLNFFEINIDVYPEREKEFLERTNGASPPQMFFNEKLIGGLVALNSLRNSGTLESTIEEILSQKCPPEAPSPPAYAFDAVAMDSAVKDEMTAVMRVARKCVPIQDRVMTIKFVKNCFSGAELVEVLIHHLDCGRKKAVEIGKKLARKHFIHHVSGENDFEDGNHYYRFLEHEPFIPKCHNIRVVNDFEPNSASALSQRLFCLMSAILESYSLDDDRKHLDYVRISNSEEFRRYRALVEDLQRVDLMTLSEKDKLVFFLNLHNAMAIHAVTRIGPPGPMINHRIAFFSEFMYVLGGYSYSLSTITNGILRGNRRTPYFLVKPFSKGDKRLELALEKPNPLIHFGIWNAAKGSPSIRFFTTKGIDCELRTAARAYLQREDGVKVDLTNRIVYLPKIIKWYAADFGDDKEILKWIINFLNPSQAGLFDTSVERWELCQHSLPRI